MTMSKVLWYITWIASAWGDVMRGWVRGIYHAMYWESVSKPCLALGPNCLGLKRCIGHASQLHLALSYSTVYAKTLDLLHALSGSMTGFGICWMRPNCRATRSGIYRIQALHPYKHYINRDIPVCLYINTYCLKPYLNMYISIVPFEN